MNRKRLSEYSKIAIIALGTVVFVFAVLTFPASAFNWGYFLLLVFSVTITPRLSLTLPRPNLAISFSDALIFISLVMFGGPAAIVLATAETQANCLYLRSSGIKFGRLMILTNVSISAVTTTITYLVWLGINQWVGTELQLTKTQHLIPSLGILALSQFCVSTFFAAIFHFLQTGENLWETWKKYCFSSSMTQIVGAGLAGLIFTLINFGDPITSAVASFAVGIAYFTYRQSISQINTAIEQVEEAEREKAETERQRRLEAESHALQLSSLLEQEERANAALRKSKRDFKYAALHDSLTNLANRKKLGDILRSLIAEYKEDPATNFYVLFLDIRRFKNINDSLGHTIGDKVLMIAAKRFVRMLTKVDMVARLGGDEFAIILRDLSTVGKAQKVARRISQSISQPFSLSGNRISVNVNIGIAPCDTEYETPEDILRDADIAMHYAKEKDIGVAVFTKELRERFLERARFEIDLRHALERNELSMYYQPIISLSDGHLVGFEALLRWHHSEAGLIPPNKFIPIAEESGLILPITQWILNETCGQLMRWQHISPDSKNLIISVNISGKHLSTDDLIDDVENALETSKLPPSSLKLEITESAAMENAEHTINMLNRLKQLGVQLSIDDFGTGYSSLSHLHRLPFDTLKIDRSFVYRVGDNGENSEILQTIISLAKNLKMRVIAEGIETESQLAVLQNLGCDYGQGFLMAKPKPVEETEKLLYTTPYWLPADHSNVFERSDRTTADENLPVF